MHVSGSSLKTTITKKNTSENNLLKIVRGNLYSVILVFMTMDRYGYQDEIRRAAAKSVKDLNLSNASASDLQWSRPVTVASPANHHQRASVSARIEQLQQQATTANHGTSPRRKSLGTAAGTPNKTNLYNPHQASQTLKAPLNGGSHQQGKKTRLFKSLKDIYQKRPFTFIG